MTRLMYFGTCFATSLLLSIEKSLISVYSGRKFRYDPGISSPPGFSGHLLSPSPPISSLQALLKQSPSHLQGTTVSISNPLLQIASLFPSSSLQIEKLSSPPLRPDSAVSSNSLLQDQRQLRLSSSSAPPDAFSSVFSPSLIPVRHSLLLQPRPVFSAEACFSTIIFSD